MQTEIAELNERARAAGSTEDQEAAVIRLSGKEADLDRMQTELATAQSLRTGQEEPVTPRQPLSARVLAGAGRRLRHSLTFGGRLEQGMVALRQAQLERSLQREERKNERLTANYLRNTNPFTGERVVKGELRMCGRCHAGPFMKNKGSCNNMSTHNDNGANSCRNCGWFNSSWANWPEWDGVVGPH